MKHPLWNLSLLNEIEIPFSVAMLISSLEKTGISALFSLCEIYIKERINAFKIMMHLN